MNVGLERHLLTLSSPANLRINDQIIQFRENCLANGCKRPYHHFAFGQSPYPPPLPIVDALAAHAGDNAYLPAAGLPLLRDLIAQYYRHHFDLECSADQVIVSPGSKEMISILLSVLEGDVLIPTPSWVSYLPQARILRKQVITLPTTRAVCHKLTPNILKEGLKHSQSRQSILILNHPNNPTGIVYTLSELEEIAEVCRQNHVFVVSDEIYAGTVFCNEKFISMGRVFPEGTVVTGGISKDRSCGGYRLGVGIFPKEPAALMAGALKVAGSTYSCVAAPIQQAAIAAYTPDERIDKYVADCISINKLVGCKMASLLRDIPGVTTTIPHGGFYLFVDFNQLKQDFLAAGLKTCEEFCEDLLAVEHTALLPGNSLLLDEDDFSVRCSFVDFDGRKALSQWQNGEPGTEANEDAFLSRHCPLVIDGVGHLARYISEIRGGHRPQHLME